MMHRTLLLTATFPPAVGGAERYLEHVARGLDRDQVIVIAPPNDRAATYDASSGIDVIRRDLHRSRLIRPAWLWHLGWLISLIRREKITRLIFGHYGGFAGLGPIIKFLTGTPFIVSVFGLDFTAYRKTAARRSLLRWTLRHAEWVTTISRHTQSLLHDFGVPYGKIVLAPPGVDRVERPTPEQINSFRERYGLRDSDKLLLTVGRLVKRKGHLRVIRALPLILKQVPDLHYIIVGAGPYRDAIEGLMQQLNLADRVHLLGQIDDQELLTAFGAADLFITTPVASHDDPEGFGIVFTEALRVGTPIVATTSGGVSDIIQHEKNGIGLSDQASDQDISAAVIRLMNDTPLRHRLGETGRADVLERFSIDKQLRPFRVLLTRPDDPDANPLISVVIPTWNNAESLTNTLHHLMLQTYRHLEVIVVDDGSTDHTVTAVKKFPHVTYIARPHAGAPAARNAGRAAAHGEFILFCDADVTPHPRMIERMATALRLKPGAAYAYCNFRFGWRTFDLFDFSAERLKRSNYISMMSLIRRSACPKFDESIGRLQDWDLWLTMLARNETGTWVPSRLFSAAAGKRGISRKIQAPPAAAVQTIRQKHHLEESR